MNILQYFAIEYCTVFYSSYSTPLTRTARGPNAHAQYEISHSYTLQQHTRSSKMDEELQQFIQQNRAVNTIKKSNFI